MCYSEYRSITVITDYKQVVHFSQLKDIVDAYMMSLFQMNHIFFFFMILKQVIKVGLSSLY